jgi:hypothetical protein
VSGGAEGVRVCEEEGARRSCSTSTASAIPPAAAAAVSLCLWLHCLPGPNSRLKAHLNLSLCSLSVPRSMWSFTRPGVPTTTSTPCTHNEDRRHKQAQHVRITYHCSARGEVGGSKLVQSTLASTEPQQPPAVCTQSHPDPHPAAAPLTRRSTISCVL